MSVVTDPSASISVSAKPGASHHAGIRGRLPTSLDDSAYPIGGTVNQGSVKTRLVKPVAMCAICFRSTASVRQQRVAHAHDQYALVQRPIRSPDDNEILGTKVQGRIQTDGAAYV